MDLLYHYTTQAGLLGILGSKSIWCTNTLFLNDPTEFSHAIDLGKMLAGSLYENDFTESFGFQLRHKLESATPVACMFLHLANDQIYLVSGGVTAQEAMGTAWDLIEVY